MSAPVLTLAGLRLEARGTPVPLLAVPSLVLRPGLTAVVGASGAGKSLLGRALVGQVHVRPGVVAGTLQLGDDPPRALAGGRRLVAPAPEVISWACQHGREALVPQWTIARHLRAVGADPAQARARLAAFGLGRAVLAAHPHALSGGMAQRAHLALALAGDPPWLVADEVSTGLDASAGRQVLRHLADRARGGRGVLLVSHDLDLVKDFADRILVMDAGRVVADVAGADWDRVDHPAARRLIAAAHRLEGR